MLQKSLLNAQMKIKERYWSSFILHRSLPEPKCGLSPCARRLGGTAPAVRWLPQPRPPLPTPLIPFPQPCPPWQCLYQRSKNARGKQEILP